MAEDLVKRLRDRDAIAMSGLTYCGPMMLKAADLIEQQAASLAEKDKEIEMLRERSCESSVRAYEWMRRHDRIAAGKDGGAYPSPADVPALLARARQAERALKTSEAQLDEMTRSCLAEREGRLKAIEILTIWSHDGSLQTFEHREKFRKIVRAFVAQHGSDSSTERK